MMSSNDGGGLGVFMVPSTPFLAGNTVTGFVDWHLVMLFAGKYTYSDASYIPVPGCQLVYRSVMYAILV